MNGLRDHAQLPSPRQQQYSGNSNPPDAMLLTEIPINAVAVVAGALLAFGMGWAWYSPALFGKHGERLFGMPVPTSSVVKKRNAWWIPWSVAILSAVATSAGLAYAVVFTGAVTFLRGMETGFLLWLGFVLSPHAVDGIFQRKPLRIMAVHTGYHLATMLVVGGVAGGLAVRRRCMGRVRQRTYAPADARAVRRRMSGCLPAPSFPHRFLVSVR